jgi:hypothetical protein
VARTGSGDVYAGRDGNVYRNQGEGWQKYDSGGWNSVATPEQRQQAQQRANDARAQGATRSTADSPTMGQLNRDSAARAEGAQRTRDYSSTSRSGSSSRSGSYRPSGGGMRSAPRGGGGRRR